MRLRMIKEKFRQMGVEKVQHAAKIHLVSVVVYMSALRRLLNT